MGNTNLFKGARNSPFSFALIDGGEVKWVQEVEIIPSGSSNMRKKSSGAKNVHILSCPQKL